MLVAVSPNLQVESRTSPPGRYLQDGRDARRSTNYD